LASNSLTECFVQGKRAALAGLDEPRLHVAPDNPPAAEPIAPPSQETRDDLWRHAGLTRDAEGLARLATDPHPLARLVAACATLRQESRGAHVRSDFPDTDPALDGHHAVVRNGGDPAFERWT
jgi:L-aspartate oxidase